jgi:hypothetical protein
MVFRFCAGLKLRDARLEKRVQMSDKDIANWTDAIEKEQ